MYSAGMLQLMSTVLVDFLWVFLPFIMGLSSRTSSKEWDYKGVTCNSAGARAGVDCCRSKGKAIELRLAGRSLPGSSGSLTMRTPESPVCNVSHAALSARLSQLR